MRRFTGVAPFSLDLHVLSAPLTFVLSQDQTLQLNLVSSQVAAGMPQSPGSGLFESESHFGRRAAGMADADLALP